MHAGVSLTFYKQEPDEKQAPMNINLLNSTLLLSTFAMTVSCQAPDGQEWKPTFGVSTTVIDNFEFEGSAFGYTESADIDYSMTQVELGATRVSEGIGRPIKHEFVGLALGSGDLSIDDVGEGDLKEFSAGGNFYFDDGKSLIPFLSVWSTIGEYADNSNASKQLNLRLGGGVEYAVSDQAALTFAGDYLLPLVDAEDDVLGVDFNTSGFAIRIGLRFVL
jgi:hypothetical protein